MAQHLEENLDEARIECAEVGLALVNGEGGEPFEDGGPGARVGVGVGVGELGRVEGDVGGEAVDQPLVGSHEGAPLLGQGQRQGRGRRR